MPTSVMCNLHRRESPTDRKRFSRIKTPLKQAAFFFCFPSHPDETEFRNFIVWLEDQKIRHYKIEDRGNLRNISSSEWPESFEKVTFFFKSVYTEWCEEEVSGQSTTGERAGDVGVGYRLNSIGLCC